MHHANAVRNTLLLKRTGKEVSGFGKNTACGLRREDTANAREINNMVNIDSNYNICKQLFHFLLERARVWSV